MSVRNVCMNLTRPVELKYIIVKVLRSKDKPSMDINRMEHTKAQTDYAKGLIYTIRSPHIDKYYIGSTTQALCKRLSTHNANYKRYLKEKHGVTTSFEILKLEDAYIELLEACPCNNKMELTKREGELIRQYKNEIVNKKIEGRTNKQYKVDNKVQIVENAKQYYQSNKLQIAETQKQYCQVNKEKKKARAKLYYNKNKDILLQKAKDKYNEGKQYKKTHCIELEYMVLE